MPLHVKMSENGALDLVVNQPVDGIVTPIKANLEPYSKAGRALLKEADENKVESYLLEKNYSEHRVILTPSYNLKSKKIKYIAYTKVSPETKIDSRDIDLELSNYYVEGLKSAVPRNSQSIAISLVSYVTATYPLEQAVRVALLKVSEFSNAYPDIRLHLLFEDSVSFECYLKIKDDIDICAVINDSVDFIRVMESKKMPFGLSSSQAASSVTVEDETKDHNSEAHDSAAVALKPLSLSLTSSHANIYAFSNFETAPITPPPLKGRLPKQDGEMKDEQQDDRVPVHQVKLAQSGQERWQLFSSDFFINQFDKPVVDVDKERLSFILGPVIYPLISRYENGALNKVEWDRSKLICKSSFLSRAIDGLEIYGKYLEHQQLFLYGPDDFGEVSEEFKIDFETIKDEYAQEINSGLSNYKAWIEQNEYILLGNVLGEKWQLIKAAKAYDIANDKKEELKLFIKSYIDSWIEDEIKKANIKGLGSITIMFTRLFEKMSKFLADIIDRAANIELILKRLTDEITKLAALILTCEQELVRVNDDYEWVKKAEENRYSEFVSKWTSKRDNLIFADAGMLRCDQAVHHPGLTVPQLIEVIIAFNNTRDYKARHPNNVRSLYKLTRPLQGEPSKLHLHLQSELRKHYLDPSYERHITAAKLFHTVVIQQEKNADAHDDENIKQALAGIAANTSAILRASIHTPPGWGEIAEILTHIACKSEAQLSLKLKLLNYIYYRNPASNYNYLSTLMFDNDQLVDRRRQITYLTSCLFLASVLHVDKNLLFRRGPVEQADQVVGVELILKNFGIDKIKKSYLKNILEQFMFDLNNGELLYIKSERDLSLEEIIESPITGDEMFKLSSHQIDIQAPVYESERDDQMKAASLVKMFGVFRANISDERPSNNPYNHAQVRQKHGR
jgi:O-acetyl-ADP-ribose deacetylase (regulator of RNase III)